MNIKLRECGTCTKCCDGTVNGEIYGHKMFPGTPCHFIALGSGCTIYEDRPETPCKNFRCRWLDDESIPEWMKPNISSVIIIEKEISGIPYIQMVSDIHPPSVEVLSWFFTWGKSRYVNIYWTIGSAYYYLGSEEFCEAVSKFSSSDL